jgi:carboxyl-terminal processing protease
MLLWRFRPCFCPDNVTVVSTNGQLDESKFTFKAAPEYYQRRGGADTVAGLGQNPPKVFTKKYPWWCWSTKAQPRPVKSWLVPCKTTNALCLMGSQTFGKGSVQTVRQLGADTALKITTARYYTPSGRSIQAKGIVPELLVDDTAEGSPYAALRTREADLEKHLNSGQGAEVKDPAREKAREEALKRLEEESKKPVADRKSPEFGSAEDFQLQQALNHLKNQPVKVSKTLSERPAATKEE